jgi:hypothetical protein
MNATTTTTTFSPSFTPTTNADYALAIVQAVYNTSSTNNDYYDENNNNEIVPTTTISSSTTSSNPMNNHNNKNETALTEAVSLLLSNGYTFTAAPYDPTSIGELFALIICSFIIFALPLLIYSTCRNRCCTNNKQRIMIPITFIEWKRIIKIFITKLQNPGGQLSEERRRFGIEKAAILLIERELARMLIILSILGVIILVPIHLFVSGNNEHENGALSSFSRTTIQNLSFETHQDLFWLHCFFTVIFSILVFYGLEQRIRVLITRLEQEDQTPRNFVEAMIFASGPASSFCTEMEMKNALNMICPPGLGVKGVRHLKRNIKTDNKLPWRSIITFESTEGAREFLRDGKNYFLRSAKELLRLAIMQSPNMSSNNSNNNNAANKQIISPSVSSTFKVVHNKSQHVPVDEMEERERLLDSSGNQAATTTTTATTQDVITVTTSSSTTTPPDDEENTTLLQQHTNREDNETTITNTLLPASTELTHLLRLRVDEWILSRAPDSNDIIYDSLNMSPTTFWAQQIITIIGFLVFLLFLTTPISFLSFFSSTSPELAGAIQTSYSQFISGLPRFVAKFLYNFLPQLFLVICDSWLLFGVQIMAKFIEPAFTYSGREISIMRKSFAFLLFNTLILPSLALTSVGAFLASMIWDNAPGSGSSSSSSSSSSTGSSSSEDNGSTSSPFVLLGRVFVTSSGAFSLAFIAVQTWVGGLMDLTRLTERFMHKFTERIWNPLREEFQRPNSMLFQIKIRILQPIMTGLVNVMGKIQQLVQQQRQQQQQQQRNGSMYEVVDSGNSETTPDNMENNNNNNTPKKLHQKKEILDEKQQQQDIENIPEKKTAAVVDSSCTSPTPLSSQTIITTTNHNNDSLPKFEYEIGSNHAMLQTVFAITMVFSVVVPFILPFSLIYFLHKVAIDEYFLWTEASCHALDTSLRARVARVAVTILHWPVLLFQASMLGYFSSRACSESTLSDALQQQQLRHPQTHNLCLNGRGIAGVLRMRGSIEQVVILTIGFIISCLYVLNDTRKHWSTLYGYGIGVPGSINSSGNISGTILSSSGSNLSSMNNINRMSRRGTME